MAEVDLTALPGEVLIQAAMALVKGARTQEAARRLGISRQTLWRWRRGDWTFLGKDGRDALAKAISESHVDIATLIPDETSAGLNKAPPPTEGVFRLITLLYEIGELPRVAAHAGIPARDWIVLAYNNISLHSLPAQHFRALEAIRDEIMGPRPGSTVPITALEGAKSVAAAKKKLATSSGTRKRAGSHRNRAS